MVSCTYTKTFESDVVLGEDMLITNSSNNWEISVLKKFPRQELQFRHFSRHPNGAANVPWKETTISLSQNGVHIDTIAFQPQRIAKWMTLKHNSINLKRPVHVTVVEAYDGQDPGSVSQHQHNDSIDGLTSSTKSTNEQDEFVQPDRSFDQPDELSNAILVIDEHRIHVNNYFLAMHSPFFKTLFFGEFAERETQEVLNDLDYDAFIAFLRVLHPGGNAVTRVNAEAVLFVANYVQCGEVLRKCVAFFMMDRSHTLFEKLRIADKYELAEMMDTLLDNTTIDELRLAAKAGADEFSSSLKARICDKLVK